MSLWRKFADKWAGNAPSVGADAADPPGVAQVATNRFHLSGSADWDDALDLGAEPFDPLIVDLVTRNPVSVRLRNAIVVAGECGELPFQRLSDYAAAGPQANERMMRHVQNLGRKSASELDALLAAAKPKVATGPAAPTDDELRTALGAGFMTQTVEEALAARGPPARLLPAIALLGFTEKPLSALLLTYPKASADMLHLPNMGRSTVAIGRTLLGATVREALSQRGLAAEQIADAEALMLDGVALDALRRKALGEALAVATHFPPAADLGSAEAGTPEPSLEPVPTPAEIVHLCLADLGVRERDVVERRFGLAGPMETLEELGQAYGLTRERIRQIEAKALRLLKQRVRRRMSASVLQHGVILWSAVSASRDFLAASDLVLARRKAPGPYVLALEIAGMSLQDWLSRYAQPFEQGWVAPDVSIAELDASRARLDARMTRAALPCPLISLVEGEDLSLAPMVLALTGRHLHAGYLLLERPGRRLRRALGLHAVLAADGGLLFVTDLVARYRALFLDDPCSARDAAIVMEAQPQLFLEITEGSWAALGPPGVAPEAEPLRVDAIEPEVESDEEDAAGDLGSLEEGQTIAQAIENELRRTGPSRISDIIDRAPDFLPPGRSPNSVGPVLLGAKDRFVRALPGLYALHDQIPSPERLVAAPPAFLFEADQVRIYALARRAGEPWGAYPLWSPQTEYLWCVWAKQRAAPALLESLLSVAHVEAWPNIEDKAAWAALAAVRGRFSNELLQPPDALVLPDLERVFAACRFLRARQRISWMSANRILFRRVIDHSGAGLLATLVALGAVAGDSADWQAPHGPGDELAALTHECERARLEEGRLAWSGVFGAALRERGAQRPQVGAGWVTAEDANILLGSDGAGDLVAAMLTNPLEQLLAERAIAINAQSLQATFRDVAVGGRVDDD